MPGGPDGCVSPGAVIRRDPRAPGTLVGSPAQGGDRPLRAAILSLLTSCLAENFRPLSPLPDQIN